MDFATLPHSEKLKALQQMHTTFNKNLYDNCLQSVNIDIENTGDYSGAFRVYKNNSYLIVIDSTIVNCVLPKLEEQKQKEYLAIILLHEMIHQYLFEVSGNPDAGHSAAFYNAAINHGLFYETQQYNVDFEELAEPAKLIIENYTF